jgi:hypothetical protein
MAKRERGSICIISSIMDDTRRTRERMNHTRTYAPATHARWVRNTSSDIMTPWHTFGVSNVVLRTCSNG